MIKTRHTLRNTFILGYSKRIAFGISIDKYSFNIDFLCFWFAIEW